MATDDLLDGLHQRFRETLKSGQPQAVRALYGAGATVLPPNRPPLVGVEAIRSFWERARRIQDVVFEPTASERLGDGVLRESGTMRLSLQGQRQQLRTREAIYLCVWRRAEEDWRLDTIMWRFDNAQGAGGRNRQGRGPRGRQQAGQGQGGAGRRRGGGGGAPKRGNRTDDGGRADQVLGFGPRARRNRADQQAPMIPILD